MPFAHFKEKKHGIFSLKTKNDDFFSCINFINSNECDTVNDNNVGIVIWNNNNMVYHMMIYKKKKYLIFFLYGHFANGYVNEWKIFPK